MNFPTPVGLRAASLVATIVLALAGCAGSPVTRYYTLAPVAPGAAAATYAGLPIEVRTVQIPPALDRIELLQGPVGGEWRVLDFDHWAAPLARLARQALTEDLALRLPAAKVALPGTAWPPQRAVLAVDILSFEQDGGAARMTLAWSLRQPATAPDAGAPTGAMLRLSAPVSEDGAGATARAFGALLAQASDQIVAASAR